MIVPTVQILGTSIARSGMNEALSQCESRVKARQGGYVCFVNVHTATESTTHAGLRSALDQSTYNFADGMPLVWVSRLTGQAIGSRVCGPDFTADFLRKHKDIHYGLIGGAPGRAAEFAKLQGISATCYSPPLRAFSKENSLQDWQSFLKLCPGGQAPSVVWIGLGAPKQELWMQAVSKLAPQTLFFGIGAAFDFLSGSKARAPIWMQRTGLEWFYRLIQEPRRLAGRYFATNTLFLWKFLLQTLGSKSK